ncbi:hypothetical protein S40293_10575 [Stachybotrys chartarum IBT 40293]|nr:hypothetical protein S40293_10575 [Stachybotrys chartarum IBT 40293]
MAPLLSLSPLPLFNHKPKPKAPGPMPGRVVPWGGAEQASQPGRATRRPPNAFARRRRSGWLAGFESHLSKRGSQVSPLVLSLPPDLTWRFTSFIALYSLSCLAHYRSFSLRRRLHQLPLHMVAAYPSNTSLEPNRPRQYPPAPSACSSSS